MKLTPRDIDILDDLRIAVDNWVRIGAGEWVRPLDCGGRNGSDHSYRLTKLSKMGFAKRKKYAYCGSRGSCRYTITDEGRKTLNAGGLNGSPLAT